MNIFYLDQNIDRCVAFHCDRHVVKMILEYAQMLSTAHHLLSDNPHPDLYRKTHINHPCNVWVRQSKEHYLYLYNLFVALCSEYTKRYGKIHLTERKLKHILASVPDNIPDAGFVDPPKCMPDQYKADGVIESYRNFYNYDKARFAEWKYTPKPNWFSNLIGV